MKSLRYLAAALLTASAFAGGQAHANMCRADPLICPTTMPADGFCQCRAHGTTLSGTVTAAGAPSVHYNATAGGCGAEPNDPGCHIVPTQPAETPMPPALMQPPPMDPPSMPPPPMPPPG